MELGSWQGSGQFSVLGLEESAIEHILRLDLLEFASEQRLPLLLLLYEILVHGSLGALVREQAVHSKPSGKPVPGVGCLEQAIH